MPAWICSDCARRFARAGQAHECAPAMDLEEYFSTGPERERPIFDAVYAHVSTLGPVHVEPVSVGIFLKRARSFAQLRPMARWIALSFSLAAVVCDPRITRKPTAYSGRYHHVVNLRGPADVDGLVRDCLTEAYFATPE